MSVQELETQLRGFIHSMCQDNAFLGRQQVLKFDHRPHSVSAVNRFHQNDPLGIPQHYFPHVHENKVPVAATGSFISLIN